MHLIGLFADVGAAVGGASNHLRTDLGWSSFGQGVQRAELSANLHQQAAHVVFANAVALAPEVIAPFVAFDELGVFGCQELGGEFRPRGEFDAKK